MTDSPDAKRPNAASKTISTQPLTGTLELNTMGAKPSLTPGLTEPVNKAGQALKAKNFKAFQEEIAKAEKIYPDDPKVLHFKGLYEFETKNAVGAFHLLQAALQKTPKDAALQHNMAAVLISLGKFEEAEKLLLSAIALKPDYAEACHTLSPIRTFSADDPLIPTMEKGLQAPSLSEVDRSFYGFALAKAQDDAGQHAKAWDALEIGNAAMPAQFDMQRETDAVEALETLATRDRLEALAPYGHQSPAPIFVVGMPRSGTTLLESLLGAHPQVHAAGELTALGGIGQMMSKRLGVPAPRLGQAEALAAATPEHVFAGGLGYLNAARERSPGWFDHFVDKLPDNSFNLGLAAALLPNARVLHIMRHPLDIMLSIWFQRFTSVRFAFRPEHIVHHWKTYQRVMAHWRTHLPLEMIELRYENLVQDTEFAQGYLWDRLGLSQQVDHVPVAPGVKQQRTASRFQVTQPVYTSSREKFRRYEAHMGAFIEAMGGMDVVEAEVAVQEGRCALRAAAQG